MQFLMGYMQANKLDVVDCKKADEDEWAQHCAEADLATAPLRNRVTYYNGEGTAKPGSLAYYGTQWGRRVGTVKKTLNANGPDSSHYNFETNSYTWESQMAPASKL